MKTQKTEFELLLPTYKETMWKILTSSDYTKQYMFNCSVETTWTIGSPIIWTGEYEGHKAYQKGEILDIKPFELIKYSTFAPNYGLDDIPENYIHVSIILKEISPKQIKLKITNETFDGNKERMSHIAQGWQMVVGKLNDIVENLK